MLNTKKGFTLIELLIVIGIIGILAGVIIAVINPTRMRNRAKDAVIKTTLEKMGLALAANYASNLKDPTWAEFQSMIAITSICNSSYSFRIGGVLTNWAYGDCPVSSGGAIYYYNGHATLPGCVATRGFDGYWYAIDRNGVLKKSTSGKSLYDMCWLDGLDGYPNAD